MSDAPQTVARVFTLEDPARIAAELGVTVETSRRRSTQAYTVLAEWAAPDADLAAREDAAALLCAALPSFIRDERLRPRQVTATSRITAVGARTIVYLRSDEAAAQLLETLQGRLGDAVQARIFAGVVAARRTVGFSVPA